MIRAARPDDHDAIVAVTRAAFKGKEKALRIVRDVAPEISIVWEENSEVLGHTMLSRMQMGEHRPLQLSPGDFGDAWMAAKLDRYDPSYRGQVVFPPAFD